MAWRLRRAAESDLDWLVAQEERPEHAAFIGRSPRDEHLRNLGDADKYYTIAEAEDGDRLAFAILRGLNLPQRSIELFRVAVAEANRGLGKELMRRLIDLAFTELGANRLWLDVYDDNERARHVYRTVGFREEGVLREASLRANGELGSLVVMSILVREYTSNRH